jgi:uncharacterized protein (TIGR00369 family)
MGTPLKIKGFGEDIGLAMELLDEGHSRVTLELQGFHKNFFGIVHGGVLLTMLDQTCGAAMRSIRSTDKPQGSVTIDLQTVFTAPAQGRRLVGYGEVHRMGRSVAMCKAEILDEAETLIATASGSFKLLT